MSASHRHTFDTIPWLVNGRVSDDERRALDEHLRECAECSSEFDQQQRLHTAISADESRVDYAPGASLQKLWSRIGREDLIDQPTAKPIASVSFLPGTTRAARSRMMQWLAAAVVVEAVGITLLAATLMNKPAPSNAFVAPPASTAYVTVTTTQIVPASATLLVAFAPNFTVSEVNALLQQRHLEVVNGPNSVGAYTLASSAAAGQRSAGLPRVLADLRAHPGVRFAEAIAQPAVHTAETNP